ncbi:MAG: DUF2442 domain-containing protein [Candidatus Omnitrophota bacterium]
MKWVTKAKYIDSFKVWIKFNDNIEGIVDLESTITNDHREIFRMLRDQQQFKKFEVNADTLVWENGLDLAPEYLYELATQNQCR